MLVVGLLGLVSEVRVCCEGINAILCADVNPGHVDVLDKLVGAGRPLAQGVFIGPIEPPPHRPPPPHRCPIK